MELTSWCGIYVIVIIAVFLFFLVRALRMGRNSSNHIEYEITKHNFPPKFDGD